jgi:glycerate 2-kinase
MARSSGAANTVDSIDLLHRMFAAAVEAAQPEKVMAAWLPPRPKGRTVVIGAGKASAAMAAAFEAAWDGPLEGLVVTRYGHAAPTTRIQVVEAAHPVPDANGVAASHRLLELVANLGPDDLIVALVSGGGSALLTLPPPNVSLEAVQGLTRMLLESGAPIMAMNCVRKHVSRILGGRLAAAAPHTPMVTLVVSDVPGDDAGAIASGPTVPDPTTTRQARAILDAYAIRPDPAIAVWLEHAEAETPKPDDPSFAGKKVRVICSAMRSLRAAADLARRHGYTPLILSDAIEGESREVAKVHAALARSARRHGEPTAPPVAILSGGETTVTVRHRGRGGRNGEFALALALADEPGVHALAADTDGIDGTENNAGAVIGPDTLERARGLGLDPMDFLDRNDSYPLFQALGALLITGPTRTNVNDFRAVLVQP